MVQIKECPVCGTEAFTTVIQTREDEVTLKIRCNNPRCGIVKTTNHKFKIGNTTFDDIIGAIHIAVNSWNCRIGTLNE